MSVLKGCVDIERVSYVMFCSHWTHSSMFIIKMSVSIVRESVDSKRVCR